MNGGGVWGSGGVRGTCRGSAGDGGFGNDEDDVGWPRGGEVKERVWRVAGCHAPGSSRKSLIWREMF